MSKLSKREQIEQSIDGILRLLNDIVHDPSAYVENDQVLQGLKSQGSLCSLNLEFQIGGQPLTIRPISLNTLKKKLAPNGPDRDLAFLDKLRTHAQNAISRSRKPPEVKRRSRSAMEQQVEDLKAKVSSLHAVNMVLLQALEINRKDLITISDTPGTGLRQKRIKDAIDRIIRIVGMNPAPFNDVTLLSMEKHLKLVQNEKANR